MHQQYDKASKESLQDVIAALVVLFGVFGTGKVKSLRFKPSGVVMSGRDPDHVLEFVLEDGRTALIVVELATFAAGTAGRETMQMARGMATLFAKNGEWPGGLMIVLAPKGQLQVPDHAELASLCGTSKAALQWKTVHAWDFPAEDFLAFGDPALAPWATLGRHHGDGAELLDRCAALLATAPAERQDSLRALTWVFGSLNFEKALLARVLGDRPMLDWTEFPAVREFANEFAAERVAAATTAATANAARRMILRQLQLRFGAVPAEVAAALAALDDEERLLALGDRAVLCQSMTEFREGWA